MQIIFLSHSMLDLFGKVAFLDAILFDPMNNKYSQQNHWRCQESNFSLKLVAIFLLTCDILAYQSEEGLMKVTEQVWLVGKKLCW